MPKTHVMAAALILATTVVYAQQSRPAIGESVTTASGLVYKFTKQGKGLKPETGDLMVIEGIGKLADGTEFWNTRTDGTPFEYSLGVDSVIKGFSEGMKEVREGDRIIITMKPELAYGDRARTGIPANSTLTFDYEIIAVKPLSFAKVMREALAATSTVDDAIAKVKATPNLKKYYVSASTVQSAASAANRKKAGEGEKVLALGLTLLPKSYQLHQAIGRAQTQRGAKADAIKSYESALKLNRKKNPTEIRDYDATTKALADLRK
jgi:hypothetical protein